MQAVKAINQSLQIREATTFHDAEAMRQVRNACRIFMTRTQEEITFERQKEWFLGLDRKVTLPYVASCQQTDPVQIGFEEVHTEIGYGLIRFAEERWWVSAGLLPHYRGKGYGEQLFRYLIDAAGTPCWLEVLETNIPAWRLYCKLGFREVTRGPSSHGTVITMVMDDPGPEAA